METPTMRAKLSHRDFSDAPSDATEAALRRQQIEYRRRSHARLQIGVDDLARMVNEFAASHGGIVMCAPAYAAPSHQYHS
jgi:hypothetical protein